MAQLQNVQNDVTKNYKLEADLDLTGVTFNPIGDGVTGYSGTFDGNNHTISNWSFTTPSCSAFAGGGGSRLESNSPTYIDYNEGFFRILANNGVVENLTLANVSMLGCYYTGALVGYMKTGSLVSNCNATTNGLAANVADTSILTGIIVGYNNLPVGGGSGHTGGLVGEAQAGSTITLSNFSGLVRGAMHVGGLVGETYGTVTLSSSSGAGVSGDGNSGGLIGNLGAGSASLSYSTMTVFQTGGNAGGFVGSVNGGATVTSSYYNGDVNGPAGMGGFVGYVSGAGSKVSKCYSLGTVTSTNGLVGGFAGWVIKGGAIEDSYTLSAVTYNSDSTWGQPSGAGGFAGVVDRNGDAGSASLNRVYAAGSIILGTGGLVVNADLTNKVGTAGVVTNSFANSNISTNGFINLIQGTVTGSSALSTANMKIQASYTGWDFTNVWTIAPAVNSGYPTLR